VIAEPRRSWAGLVQQTVQIVASLRSHDLTLVVGRTALDWVTTVMDHRRNATTEQRPPLADAARR
jgi:hypothetical protein